MRLTGEQRSSVTGTALLTGVMTVTVSPVFTTTAASGAMHRDFGLTSGTLGIAVASFFVAAGIGSKGFVRIRAKPKSILTVTVAAAGLVNLAIGLLVRSDTILIGSLALAGVLHGVNQAATNLALVTAAGRNWLGRAFGVKQSGGPVAGLLAGIAIPVFSQSIGWRGAFLAVSGFVLVICVFVWRHPLSAGVKTAVQSPSFHQPDRSRVLAAFGCSAAAVGTAASSFAVITTVAAGWSSGSAALLFAAAASTTIVARFVGGWAIDIGGLGGIQVSEICLVSGAIGCALLSFLDAAWVVPGVVLACAGGWGWAGALFHHAATANRAPQVTSSLLLGVGLGAALGPLSFGAIADLVSLQIAWIVTGVVSVGSVLLLRFFSSSSVHATFRNDQGALDPYVSKGRRCSLGEGDE